MLADLRFGFAVLVLTKCPHLVDCFDHSKSYFFFLPLMAPIIILPLTFMQLVILLQLYGNLKLQIITTEL